ncbi:reductase [Lithospermum erythrorhizon]|uniref:Reductase n=1 Tax=Lithospermum erythrorhizon TaxID=34254 RepID=A0AAV3RK79_LITER
MVKDLQSKAELDNLLSDGKPLTLHFWATWCKASKQMDKVFPSCPLLQEAYSVSAVPFLISCKDAKTIDTLEGADPSSLANKVAKVAGYVIPGEPAAPASLGMAAGAAVLESVNELAKGNEVEFGSFDIFSDNEVRESLKKFSNWPTFPQLYCNGELLGGCDIAVAMHESVTKGGTFDSSGVGATLSSRLGNLINSSPVMLFMKGNPEEPRCGFSRKVVDILRQEKVNFDSFDILADDEVCQGLKKSGELGKVLAEKGITSGNSVEDRLKQLTTSSPVMKGTPDAPKCGFSSKVVNALKEDGIDFGSFDILTDDAVRQGLKTYSNWPTFPQLYYKGELIGGCDIVLEMRSSGELKATLSE